MKNRIYGTALSITLVAATALFCFAGPASPALAAGAGLAATVSTTVIESAAPTFTVDRSVGNGALLTMRGGAGRTARLKMTAGGKETVWTAPAAAASDLYVATVPFPLTASGSVVVVPASVLDGVETVFRGWWQFWCTPTSPPAPPPSDTPAPTPTATATPISFGDVPTTAQFYKEISWLASQGISTGWSSLDGTKTFQPLSAVNRDAMAAFLYRLAGNPSYTPPALSQFRDVPTTSQFYKEISWLASQGISTGWTTPDGIKTFQPLSAVNRDAMAAFLYRFASQPSFTPPTHSPFTDVPATSQFYKEISWLASTGISAGWTAPDRTKVFQPLSSVARDAMAAFMYRYHDIP